MVWAIGVCVVFSSCMVAPRRAVAADKKPGEKKPVDKKMGPWVHFPFDSLGIPRFAGPFLSSGSSMLTVHVLDGKHLLVTYSTRSLVPRLRGDPAGDDDRLVAAEIVDLPSGHIAAQTQWHMHDHGRYLWKLNRGRFLVRIGDRMYTMAPKANLASGDPFLRTVFPNVNLRPSVVDVSADGGIVTLETVLDAPDQTGSTVVLLGDQDSAQPTSQTVINFFRLDEEKGSKADFEVKPAGALLSPEPVYIPVGADGYLWAQPMDDAQWNMTFDSYGGRTVQLGKIVSSCRPRLQMISRSEFLAVSCRGSDDNLKIASYGLDGRETWEEGMTGVGAPTFAFAPAAARFAISETGIAEPPPPTEPDGLPTVPRQEVRVYQNASGDLLLRVECTPIFKTAENFDLAEDGMLAAVVKDGAILVYKLPPLTKRDEADMAEVGKFAPPVSTATVTLARITKSVGAEKVEDVNSMAAAEVRPEAAVSTTSVGGSAPSAAPAVAGKPSALAMAAGAIRPASPQSQETGPRPAPTLLKPGEKPEYGAGNVEPE
jgi:hypothetical protein